MKDGEDGGILRTEDLLLLGGGLGDVFDSQSYESSQINTVFPCFARPDIPGGKLCLNFSAFSESSRDKVYRYLEHRILNLVTVLVGPMAAIFLAERPVVELGLIRTVVFFTRAAMAGDRG